MLNDEKLARLAADDRTPEIILYAVLSSLSGGLYSLLITGLLLGGGIVSVILRFWIPSAVSIGIVVVLVCWVSMRKGSQPGILTAQGQTICVYRLGFFGGKVKEKTTFSLVDTVVRRQSSGFYEAVFSGKQRAQFTTRTLGVKKQKENVERFLQIMHVN